MNRYQISPASRSLALACAAIGGLLLLSGCKSLFAEQGFDAVAGMAGGALAKDVTLIRTPADAEVARDRVAGLLRRPLSADSAVQVALLSNRGLQAAYNEVGFAEATLLEASLPPNPTVAISRLSGSVEIEIERKIVGSILALATLPARVEIARDRFRQAQLRAADETLRLAAQTRRDYYRAVTAREAVRFLEEASASAETATKLARRLGKTGAMNKLDQAREQVFYAEIAAQLATARQRASSERERLVRSLGLWGGDLDFRLPDALPSLPARPRTWPAIEQDAIAHRFDLQIMRMETAALAKSYGLTNATRFVSLLDLAGKDKTINDKVTGEKIRESGFEIEFQIPIFDFGEARVRQAEESYMQAVHRLTEKAVNVRSEARDAYRTYRSTYDIARHYEREVLPLRKIISDETLLRYNAMLIDVFDLLLEARQRIMATIAAIEAKRDFWLASADLVSAVVGGGAGGGEGSMPRVAADSSGSAAAH
jgi:outer membrane protein TolC